ncbi:PTS sugar transporter subunit IIB [Cryobacterium suzukii]|uniref:PTS sugar transporter subunit IIB n=1 Tax=Cryobacterium suzukii TaxID=1259198 RepID=A0A4R9AG66_9MICO|nr:PTS sugar transporter subunit IIB [Cryobacterium suzukii]TFD61384.1 PTS sugar transporter subunit IIB [Cryobacterium suzukii]
MKIVVMCGMGLGTSAILKVNAERALERLEIDASVQATDVAGVRAAAADAQVILTSSELVDAIGKTNADVIVINNYFDVDELVVKLEIALGS